MLENNSLVKRLYEYNIFRFEPTKLKSGIISPIYIDLRTIISQPNLFVDICEQYVPLIKECQFDLICGVPYTALTMATYLSTQYKWPMIMRRKETKKYGTKQTLEGTFKPGNRVLIIEDLISSGASILETALTLRQAGLVVNDAIVYLDREHDGIKNLEAFNIKVHCCTTIFKVMDYLQKHGHINGKQADDVTEWIKNNKCPIPKQLSNQVSLINYSKNISFEERAKICTNPVSKKLFQLMHSKMSNLCVAADFTDCQSILRLAEVAGPHIVLLKLHADIIENFNELFAKQLRELADKHQFILFEDRKFADIGQTVSKQYSSGLFRIADWAHLVNAHLLPGPGLIKSLKKEAVKKSSELRACVLISHLSTEDNLVPDDYAKEAFRLADENRDFIIGFISQSKVTNDPTFIHMTPGVRIDEKIDGLDQQYKTPEDAVKLNGADLIIVGRGITSKLNLQSSNDELLKNTIVSYREYGYDAYMKTL